jgi:hypothetical protein
MDFEGYSLDKSKVEDGVRLPLRDAEGGLSEDYIMVRWAWTDTVRNALDELERNVTVAISAGAKPNIREKIRQGIVSMVASWHGPGFEGKECTPENVLAFLEARPDIADKIDRTSMETKRFFTSSGQSS